MDSKLQEIITSREKILLKMINLISEKKKWYSINEISQSLGLVERSVQRYVNYLCDVINECNYKKRTHFCLFMKKNKGIKLIFDQNDSINSLQVYIYKTDKTTKILLAMLFESYKSTLEYSQQKEIDIDTLNSSLKRINSFLKSVDLTVSKSDFCIKGSEAQIRILSNSIAWYFFYDDDWPEIFHQINQTKIKKTVNKMKNDLHLYISDVNQKKVTYMLAINILRYRKGNLVNYSDTWNQYILIDKNYGINRIIKSFYNSFHIYSNSEVLFAVLILLTKPFIYDVAHLKRNIINNFIRNNADILITTNLFIEEFSKFHKIPMNQQDDVYFYILRGHLLAKICKHADFNFEGNSSQFKIEKNFHKYYDQVSVLIDNLYIITKDDLFLEKVYLIKLYFEILSSAQLVSTFEEPIMIKLESDLPNICEKHMIEFIYTQVNHHFNIIFTKDSMLQGSNLTLTTLSKINKKTSSLLIDYPVTDRNITEIKDALQIVKNNY